eukprot:TRINITY_DN3994_c0_g1_i3.p2 TRINITY_DN3994_c0_g1~~TRINITY_DN3994_c0_g1_i3.p2  ORF type:complete len:101 (-),score=16.43 TRINITY_DN3994_c0_g1_i3:100-402(-)
MCIRDSFTYFIVRTAIFLVPIRVRLALQVWGTALACVKNLLLWKPLWHGFAVVAVKTKPAPCPSSPIIAGLSPRSPEDLMPASYTETAKWMAKQLTEMKS